jgi:probable HAF family extracellular repeat protein
MVDLGVLPGRDSAVANGVTRDGSLVVGYSTGGGPIRGFEWTAAGMVESDVGSSNEPFAVSADGSTVVGQANFGTSFHAYRLTRATSHIDDLGLLAGSQSSRALSVSENGSVVVGYCSFPGAPGSERAFRWTQATGMVDLGVLPLDGLGYIEATDVSADGLVVAGWCQALSGDRAFRWTQATGMVDYGPAPGATDSRAYGLSADASVAVGNGIVEFGDYRAFRWTALGHPRNLQNDLVNIYGLGTQLTGWSLTNAVSCSANGRIIAGNGIDPAGHAESWIAQVDPLPPQITNTQVNGGAAQRSRVTDLAVTFDSQVNFASSPNAAFTLTRVSDGTAVNFTATAILVDAMTVVVLNNFTGSATQFGSLADGRYTLTALASQISANGQQMTSNYTFGDAQGLFRFFGDINGDRHVDIADFAIFSNSFNSSTGQTSYLAYLDFNGDGHIDIADFGQFSIRMFTVLP